MINNIEELLLAIKNETIQEHKNQNVELKSSWSKDHGKKISAFANKTNLEVSWFIVGIEDNGILSGNSEKWAKQYEEIISQQLNIYLDPVQASLGIACYEVNSAWFIVIQLKNPGTVVKWNGVAWIATGTTVRDMTAVEVMEMTMKLPGLTDYSAQLWSGEIDAEICRNFVERLAFVAKEYSTDNFCKDNCIEILARLKIANRNVSRLLFGDTYYRFVCFDDDGEPIVNEKRKGLYNLLMDEFIKEIQTFTHNDLGGNFPERALREALANAVAHAAYFENNGDIIIELYQDKITISNLCLPESGYFANRWFSRGHKTVNVTLMEVLRICRLVDELGRGKNLIFSEALKAGKRAPQVVVEKAGRFNRWKLSIYGGEGDEKKLRLYERLRQHYKHDSKALIVLAIILWKEKKISEITKFVDEDYEPLFNDILGEIYGAVWYWKEQDQIVLSRWVKVLIGEGKDSKVLSIDEEERLLKWAYERQTQYHNGIITPTDLRKLADMGNTSSEMTLSSRLLKKWESEKKVKKLRKGVYSFIST